MEIKTGDYVRYKGKVYSVGDGSSYSSKVGLISYKDLETITIPKSDVERLTDFHVSVMRYNKELPKRRFKVGDRVRLRADITSVCFWGNTFRGMGFEVGGNYVITRLFDICNLFVNGSSVHEFEVELVEGS